jgi:hypothetical protein
MNRSQLLQLARQSLGVREQRRQLPIDKLRIDLVPCLHAVCKDLGLGVLDQSQCLDGRTMEQRPTLGNLRWLGKVVPVLCWEEHREIKGVLRKPGNRGW